MARKESIIYVNYSPYENAGKTLDFLLENFEEVFLFSIGFHNLGKNQKTNKLSVYERGKLKKEHALYHLSVPSRFISLTFLLLPIRSIINFLQILWSSWMLKQKRGKIGIFFTVNGYTAWIGLVLKRLGIVEKTVYWVWDYYPPEHQNVLVVLMRWLYWQFEKTTASSGRLVFLNRRLMNVWKQKGVILKRSKNPVVPIGTNRGKIIKSKNKKKIKLGFIGVVKKSQGLDIIFNGAELLAKAFPGIEVEIIGSGPDESYYRQKVKTCPIKVNFYGLVNEKVVERVLSSCSIGLAPYVPDPSNVSFYGDPAKVKWYLGLGLPTIITNVFELSRELKENGAGLMVDYNKPEELVSAIRTILNNYEKYRRNAIKLNKKFYYRKIYPEMFEV